MAGPDEGLNFIIGVGVDDEGVQPALDQVQSGVARTVDAVNAKLEELGGANVFRSIVEGADLATLSIRELSAGAEQATALLKIMQESQRAAAAGTGVPISKLGGLTAADIETQRALIEEQRRLLSEPLASTGNSGLSNLGRDAEQANARVRELEANLARLRAQEAEWLGNEARDQRLAAAKQMSGAPGGDPLGLQRDNGTTNPTAVEAYVAQLRADVAQSKYEAAVANENVDPNKLLSAHATALSSSLTEDRKTEQLAQQGRLAEHQAALEEQLVGLTFAERQATIGVLQARARVAEYDEAGIRAGSTRLGLIKQQEAAEERLRLVTEKQAADQEKQARAEAVGGGGGGFFGNFGYGFTHGFGGGDRGGAMGEAGFQLGMVAQYTLYYQAFRDIEDAIKASINETIDFERHVTDLSVQLGTSRDNARDLANTLGDVAAANGLSPSQGVALGQQFAGTFAGQAPATDLAVQGANIGSQLAVVTGKNAQEQLADATAAVRAFNLSYDETGRVLDAAATASQHFLGSANPANILPGLAQIGDLAAQAGFSVEVTANAIGDIVSRTGESSDAAAGELRRFLGREGNASFQKVFANEGINTTLPFQQELEQLSRKFDSLSQSERNFIVGQFGGGRAGAAALVFLEDYAKIQDAANKSTEAGGTFQREYGARLNDLRGIIGVIHGELSNLAKDFGETGVFSGFGVLLKMVEPTVKALDDLVRMFNELTTAGGHATGIRDVALAVGELYGAVLLLRKFGVGEAVGNVVANLAQRIPGIRGLPGIAGRGAEVEEAAVATGPAGELHAAAVQAATAVRSAGEELAAALQQVAVEVGGGGEQIAAAETEVAAEIAGGGAEIVAGEAAAGAEAAAGGAAGAGKGFLGASVLPALGVAVAGAVAIDAVAKAVGSQLKAENKADDTNIKGSTTDDLNASASALKEAAQASRASSGGFIGAFTNYASIYFGGEGTGAAANRADRLADLARFEARATDAANTRVAQGGDISSTISLDSQAGITTSIKNLQAQGLDAGQVLAALNERLNRFAEAANGAANMLARGQSVLVAQQIANETTNRLVTNAEVDVQGYAAGAAGISGTTADAAVKFGKLDPKAVNTVLDTAANDYFQSQGLDQGGTVSKRQESELIAREAAALRDHLRKNGFSADEVKGFGDDINLAVGESVRSRIADMNALAGQHLTQDQIGQVLQDAPQLVQQAGQEAGQRAALSGAPAGGALTTAQAALDQAKELYTTLKASGAKKQDLQPLQDEIDQLTLGTQQALIQHLQVLGDLAASLVSPNDKMGQIEAQVSTTEAELAQATDADTRSQLRAKLNQLRFQQAEQAVADANAMASAQIASGDAVGKAVTDYQNAVRTYNELVAEGAHGQPLSQAYQAMNDTRQAAVDAQVAEANAFAISRVDPRDSVGLAEQTYKNTLNQLRHTPQFGKDGKQTAQYSALAQSAEQEYVQWLQQIDQRSNARAISGIDPRNTLALAGQKIRNDRQVLADDLVGSTKYYQDLNQLHEDELSLAQDRTQKANAIREAQARAGDPMVAARVALRNARATLSDDLVGTTQYFNDLAAVNQAEGSLATAIAERARETATLRGDTTDPVHIALAELQAARVKLAQDQARHTGDLAADQLAVESAEQAAQKAVFDQQLSNQQTAYELHRESAGQYLSFLQSQDASIRSQLSGMKKGAQGYQQLVDELNQVDQLILGLNEQVSGQFNLGDIKVPSIYEVRRSLAESNQQVIDASTTNNTVTINGVDMTAVVSYLNSILGVAATGSRATTATRKAA